MLDATAGTTPTTDDDKKKQAAMINAKLARMFATYIASAPLASTCATERVVYFNLTFRHQPSEGDDIEKPLIGQVDLRAEPCRTVIRREISRKVLKRRRLW
jgi:hypothetical protein